MFLTNDYLNLCLTPVNHHIQSPKINVLILQTGQGVRKCGKLAPVIAGIEVRLGQVSLI